MSCCIASAPLGAVRHLVVAALLAAVTASGAGAQTLTAPAPPAKWVPPSKAAKSEAARAKACSAFGPGFVNVPGTGACVKVGGWVSVEGSAQH